MVPEVIFDTNGGLSFCSPGQTRTVSVPNVPYNSSNYCNWHHAYDWIVPAGWTILPTPPFTPQDFTTIPGGIRTHHTSVNITAPSTPLAPGFTGNYFITVRTEPAWSWPKEITRQIWVGTYGTSLTISGTAGVCPGNNYTYTVTPPGGQQQNGHVYTWTRPANWTTQFQGPNYIQYFVPQSPDYGPVQVSINNGCGNNTNSITAYPGFSCGGFMMTIYPNPVQDELTVQMTQTNEVSGQKVPKIDEVRLLNSEGETVLSSDEKESQIKLNV